MPEIDPKIGELEARLDSLVRTQIDFQKEITTIRRELSKLRAAANPTGRPISNPLPQQWSIADGPTRIPDDPRPLPRQPITPKVETSSSNQSPPEPKSEPGRYDPPLISSHRQSDDAFSRYFATYTASARADLEKFIGENLISKIGIVILILGVGIGAKYAIDNGWISPLMRIVFGYVVGFGLLGFAIKLKARYLNFSAVLLSGGMAVMYFVTYFGYSSYGLLSQTSAFGLMAMFTVFTVASAFIYDRQVIAHIGLVGAYAVPFLLSNNSGNYLFLFSYMAIIDAGILAISIWKYWKPLFYTSSSFTWLIFGGWFVTKFSIDNFYLALTFLGLFFVGFYASKIIHGLREPDLDHNENLICTFVTTGILFGFCFAMTDITADITHYAVFFSFVAASALAVLITSYRYYGRILVYLCYPFSWLIFGAWFVHKYRADEHFLLATIVAAALFAVFYGATLIYRLVTDEIGLAESSGMVITNSFIFYGFGYAIMDSRESLQPYEGLFTAAHSGFHLIVANAISRYKASAVDVVQVLTVLIITFATAAIPIQFDGNRVTVIWAIEAATLFWFGRVRTIVLFEYFSYIVMLLAALSMFGDWVTAYNDRTTFVSEFNRLPFANGDFIAAVVFVIAFAFIFLINRDERYECPIPEDRRHFGYALSTVGLVVLYNMFRMEISNYYHLQLVSDQMAAVSASSAGSPATSLYPDIWRYNVLWQLNYSIVFMTVMNTVNLQKTRSYIIGAVGIALSIICLALFLTLGMGLFHQLNAAHNDLNSIYALASTHVSLRYISYIIVAGLVFSLHRYGRDETFADTLPPGAPTIAFDALYYLSIFITASCELVNLMTQFHIPDALKLGLSILWSVYALILISIGIALNKKYLRIAAFVILGITLAKLFLYDIADLPTIPKTILFVSIGILMLISSFLYNKYTSRILSANVERGD